MNQTPPVVQALIDQGVLEHVGWLTPNEGDRPGQFCWASRPGETAGPPLRPLYAPAVTYRAHLRLPGGGQRTLTTNDHAVLRAVLDRLAADGAEITDIEEETAGT